MYSSPPEAARRLALPTCSDFTAQLIEGPKHSGSLPIRTNLRRTMGRCDGQRWLRLATRAAVCPATTLHVARLQQRAPACSRCHADPESRSTALGLQSGLQC